MSEGIPCDNIESDSIYFDETEQLQEPSASTTCITEDLRLWCIENFIAGYTNVRRTRHSELFQDSTRISNTP